MNRSDTAACSSTLAIFGTGRESLDFAARSHASRIAIFVPTWEDVEQARALVETRRLCDRISIHHLSAVRAAGLRLTPAPRAA